MINESKKDNGIVIYKLNNGYLVYEEGSGNGWVFYTKKEMLEWIDSEYFIE